MKFVNQQSTLIEEKDPYKKIELAGRTCYKSEDKITEDSAIKFCRGLIKSGHTAMVEHQVFLFEINTILENDEDADSQMEDYIEYLSSRPFFHVTTEFADPVTCDPQSYRVLVSANVRALNDMPVMDPIAIALKDAYPELCYKAKAGSNCCPLLIAKLVDIDDYQNLSMEEYFQHKNLTYRFVTNRAVTHELVRHRLCSFAQESTRYCAYGKSKFDGELTFIIPEGFSSWSEEFKDDYYKLLGTVEATYMKWTTAQENKALLPQQARDILTNGLKTEIVVTANLKEWSHIFNLRYFGTTGAPHPDIKALIGLAYKQAVADPKVKACLDNE